jgi:hypothetical protein
MKDEMRRQPCENDEIKENTPTRHEREIEQELSRDKTLSPSPWRTHSKSFGIGCCREKELAKALVLQDIDNHTTPNKRGTQSNTPNKNYFY